jgi:hypothetical protein
VAVQMFDFIPNETKIDMPVDQPQEVILWNDVFHPDVIEHAFSTCFLY